MTLLGDKAVGDVVKIKENGVAVNYIIVQKGKPSSLYDASCDGVWLLRESALAARAWDGRSDDGRNDYENSDITTYLNNTFFNTIDIETSTAIKTVKIPFKKGVGNASPPVQSGANGLSCKVFLLGAYEVGFTTSDNRNIPVDGAKLTYFLNGNSDSLALNKRICKDSSGSVVYWWLRSASTDNFRVVSGGNTDGTLYNSVCYFTYAVRPAFVLPTTLKVDSGGNIVFNSAPTISGSSSSGSNLSEKSAPFNFMYTVNDTDGDTVTVKEYLDNVQTRSYMVTLGAENTFEAVSYPIKFQKILNGQHTAKVVANDGKDNSEPYTVTFNKQVRTATVTLKSPLPADDVIKAAVLSVTGNIPQDASIEILVTNNALDEAPVWEDMTREVKQGINHVFANQTAVNGFAFNFKVTVTRGESDEQGYISNIGGAFE